MGGGGGGGGGGGKIHSLYFTSKCCVFLFCVECRNLNKTIDVKELNSVRNVISQ